MVSGNTTPIKFVSQNASICISVTGKSSIVAGTISTGALLRDKLYFLMETPLPSVAKSYKKSPEELA